MKPILFNTDMVRGILDGTKSVTRRVVKPQPRVQLKQMPCGTEFDGLFFDSYTNEIVKPLYQPGDCLYVRETYAPLCEAAKRHWRYLPTHGQYCYKATEKYACILEQRGCKWRPSIHMPKDAARIFLRVMDVDVEFLQDISERDSNRDFCFDLDAVNAVGKDALARPFWNSTIKPSDRMIYGWDANPQVWVIDFEQITKDEAIKFDRI